MHILVLYLHVVVETHSFASFMYDSDTNTVLSETYLKAIHVQVYM